MGERKPMVLTISIVYAIGLFISSLGVNSNEFVSAESVDSNSPFLWSRIHGIMNV